MARAPELLVTQSVLDRLSTTEDWPATRAQSIRFLRDSIKRNLESFKIETIECDSFDSLKLLYNHPIRFKSWYGKSLEVIRSY